MHLCSCLAMLPPGFSGHDGKAKEDRSDSHTPDTLRAESYGPSQPVDLTYSSMLSAILCHMMCSVRRRAARLLPLTWP